MVSLPGPQRRFVPVGASCRGTAPRPSRSSSPRRVLLLLTSDAMIRPRARVRSARYDCGDVQAVSTPGLRPREQGSAPDGSTGAMAMWQRSSRSSCARWWRPERGRARPTGRWAQPARRRALSRTDTRPHLASSSGQFELCGRALLHRAATCCGPALSGCVRRGRAISSRPLRWRRAATRRVVATVGFGGVWSGATGRPTSSSAYALGGAHADELDRRLPPAGRRGLRSAPRPRGGAAPRRGRAAGACPDDAGSVRGGSGSPRCTRPGCCRG
jgi:hypothetical protein